jgi:hypothetical protein
MLDHTGMRLLVPAPDGKTRRKVSSRRQLTTRFRHAWRMGVEGIITAGRVIIDGKQQLAHGDFVEWVENELKLGERTAQMLMIVAKHPVLANPNHWFGFPPSWRTLYELSHIRPPRMLQLIASAEIHPGMTREEAVALLPGRKQDAYQLILSADIARMQRWLSGLSIDEAVQNLAADPGDATPASIKQFGRWLIKVGDHWDKSA